MTRVFVTCSTRPSHVTTNDAVTLLPFSLVQHKCCWFLEYTTSEALQSLWILLTSSVTSCWSSHRMVEHNWIFEHKDPLPTLNLNIQKGRMLVQAYSTDTQTTTADQACHISCMPCNPIHIQPYQLHAMQSNTHSAISITCHAIQYTLSHISCNPCNSIHTQPYQLHAMQSNTHLAISVAIQYTLSHISCNPIHTQASA